MGRFKMLFLIVLCSIVLLSAGIVQAKTDSIEWVKNYGGNKSETYLSVVNSEDGGYVAAGYTYSADIGGITTNDSTNAIISKYDSNGNVVWQKSYGGSGTDMFNSVTLAKDGGYIAVGSTISSNIEGITIKGAEDAIIVKYDINGNILWQKNFGGSNIDEFYSVTLTSDGGYLAVGSTYSTDIELLTNNGFADAVIVKYDSDGNVVWYKNYGGNYYDYFESIITTSDGSFIVVGETSSTNIDGIIYEDYIDAIIVKYDSNGNMLWQKNFGGTGDDYYNSVTLAKDGGYVVVGYTFSTDIGNITNKGKSDAIIVKYDSEGNILWQGSNAGSNIEAYESVTSSNDGGYLAVGYTYSNDMPGITNKGTCNSVIVKYDSDGNIEWKKSFGGNEVETYLSVASSINGDIVVVGSTFSTDITDITNKGYSDAIIVKYSTVYDVTKNNTINGDYSLDKQTAKQNEVVTITTNPDKDYIIDEISVVDNLNNKIDVTNNKFVMPNNDVFVNVTYKKNQIINPNTNDNIIYLIILSCISIIAILGCRTFLNCKKIFN